MKLVYYSWDFDYRFPKTISFNILHVQNKLRIFTVSPLPFGNEVTNILHIQIKLQILNTCMSFLPRANEISNIIIHVQNNLQQVTVSCYALRK